MGCDGSAVGEIDPVACQPTDPWFNSRRTVIENERDFTSLQIRKTCSSSSALFSLRIFLASAFNLLLEGGGMGGVFTKLGISGVGTCWHVACKKV